MPVIQARGIERPYNIFGKGGFSRHTAHQLLKNNTHTFRLDHIEKLCRIFICEPHDLLYFVPAKDAPLPPGHPYLSCRETNRLLIGKKHSPLFLIMN